MYDAWIDDILDDVRNNVVGPFWHLYFDTPFYKIVLKHLIQQSKLDNDDPVIGNRYDLYFKYNNYYRLENNNETHRYLYDYLGVEDEHINNILMLYAIIIKQIVKTQGYEDNMLSESRDRQKEYLDKVVDRLLKESKYRLWRDLSRIVPNSRRLNKIRVEIIFALNNTWTEDPIEVFDMESIKSTALRRRRRKKEYLEDYEIEQLTNIYGLNTEEMEEVVFNYYTTLYNNIYKSYLEMNEDDKVPTSKPEEWFRGDEVFDIGGSLNESIDKQGRFLDRVVEQLVKETIIYTSHSGDMLSIPGNPDEKWNAIKMFDHLDYLYNRFLTHTIKHCRDVYGLTDEEIDYVWNNYFYEIKTNYYYQKGLNESTEKPKGMDLKYLYKVADSIMKEIEISKDNFKVRGFGPWSDMSTGGRGFWVGLEKHSKDTYGLTKAETEMVSDLVWDSLNAKNILVYNEKHKKHYGSLREQHYEDWDERAREQNINLLKAKGIDILSTDINVPFYRRIDSKEIRYLKNVVDRLDKETKLESDEVFQDGGFIVFTPFGKFEYDVFINDYRHSRFEKYVNDIYGVGDNQIMFPTHNSIAQARESAFLWEMYKDKLRRKQLKLVNPGLPDIPDDAIIIEQDLSDEELKYLDSSFENMGTPPEIASEELGELITWVKELPEELFLYRVLYLDDENQINYDELGSHYSQDRTDLINNHYNRGSIYGDMAEHAYLITVKVPKSEVDVMETLNNNILYPHEKEITLKDKGRGAKYLDIEKI